MEDNEIMKLWEEYASLLRSTNRPNIENLIQWLDESDFKTAPASTAFHSAYKGGLLKHSLNVYYAMDDFKHWIEFFNLSKDTVILTSLLHDICKTNCYLVSSRNVKNEQGQWTTVPYYAWDEELPWGHASKSVILIQRADVHLTDVEISMILNHMGSFSTDLDEKRVGKLFRVCPQSLLLHMADMEATEIIESFDGPKRYMDKMVGKNITESLQILAENSKVNAEITTTQVPIETVTVNGTEYKIAPQDAVVDDKKIIELNDEGRTVKVYAPFGDGLPF